MTVYTKKCKVCKKEFRPNNTLQKYCSYTCSYSVQKKRAKKKRREQNNTQIKKLVTKALRNKMLSRDHSKCQKCGKVVTGRNAHMSHVKSKGAYPSLKYELLNVKTMCMRCHLYWWHKEPLDANDWFRSKFPERAEVLDHLKLHPPKIDKDYLSTKLKEYLNG